jgi:FkbM family methyltransferase
MEWNVFWSIRDKARRRLYSMIRPGDTVVDVGVNMGDTLLNIASRVGSKGNVIGFEPDDRNFLHASVNIGLNAFENIELLKLGVSDRSEVIRLYRVNKFNSGMNRVLAEGEEHGDGDHISMNTITIDEMVKDHKLKRLDLIKVDIEGYEMHAFRGSLGTLDRFKPKLFFEIIPERLEKLGSSTSELIALLEDRGYSVFFAETGSKLTHDHDFRAVETDAIDLYALHNDAPLPAAFTIP